MNLAEEEARLALATRHVVEGERRITEQTILIDHLVMSGQDTARARDLLAMLEATLVQWYAHRAEIQEQINRIKAGLA